ncbi:MAG: DUF2156 domain-containing protein [Candidatus Eisenbacteria bacterium]|uniref:DUF2156 domain-containing protein n=1 Tax=Eiseniibacteriota bacterium TaxID=2212470 RepID=A0A956NB18_UNCEI|nr:DUF2156 domain-containing protein [Candidatus Eisenbacteria bacterium]MCB9464139.1 DUF2156 domain-containing protein [Candidatus Eisenbacteria bacterium]
MSEDVVAAGEGHEDSQDSHRQRPRWIVTPILCVAILLVALLTDTAANPLSPEQLESFGFGLADLFREPHRLLTAPFLVYRPSMLPSILAIVAVFVGLAETRLGWRRAVVSFVIGHLAGYVVAPFVLTLFAGDATSASGAADAVGTAARSAGALGALGTTGLAALRDVGASNGAFGAWGAVSLSWPRKRATILVASTLVYLVAAIFVEGEIWDYGHLFAFLLGIGTGVGRTFAIGRARTVGAKRVTWPLRRNEALGLGSALLGALHVVAGLSLPRHPGFERLESWLPMGDPGWPRLLLILTGVAQLVLAPGLYRGQRVAWGLTVAALAVTSVPTALAHPGPGSIVLGVLLLVGLSVSRHSFRAPSQWMRQRGGWRRALVPLGGAVLLLAFAGVTSRRGFTPALGIGSWTRIAFESVLGALGSATNAGPQPTSTLARETVRTLPFLFWPLAFLTLSRLLEGVAAPRVRRSERQVARALVERWGATGTAAMTLRRGNSLWLMGGGRAYAAFRVAYGHAVVLGQPVGRTEHVVPAAKEFAIYAREQGWSPVFYAVPPSTANALREDGWHTLKVGEEAVLPLRGLQFKGKGWQSTRTALNRAEREGIHFETYPAGTLPRARRDAILEVDRSWSQKTTSLPPMEFVLGNADDLEEEGSVVTLAVDESGKVHAFSSWLPVPARSGWVIDLMRRHETSFSGAMEFLIARSLLHFQADGAALASLATAPLADLSPDPEQSLVQSLLARVFTHVHEPYDFRSLFEFKEKFHPDWEPVYLAYPSNAELPTVALALARAHMPSLDLVHLVALVGRSAAERLWAESEGLWRGDC